MMEMKQSVPCLVHRKLIHLLFHDMVSLGLQGAHGVALQAGHSKSAPGDGHEQWACTRGTSLSPPGALGDFRPMQLLKTFVLQEEGLGCTAVSTLFNRFGTKPPL